MTGDSLVIDCGVLRYAIRNFDSLVKIELLLDLEACNACFKVCTNLSAKPFVLG